MPNEYYDPWAGMIPNETNPRAASYPSTAFKLATTPKTNVSTGNTNWDDLVKAVMAKTGTFLEMSGTGTTASTRHPAAVYEAQMPQVLSPPLGTSPTSYTQTQTSTTTPAPRVAATRTIRKTGDIPALDLPELALSDLDENKIKSLTQQHAAPAIRQFRQATNRALSRHYDNPNVAKLVTGEILRTLGTNLSTAMGSARTTARQEAIQMLGLQRQKEQAIYQADVAEKMAAYNAALQDYFTPLGTEYEYTTDFPATTTTSTSSYEKAIPGSTSPEQVFVAGLGLKNRF